MRLIFRAVPLKMGLDDASMAGSEAAHVPGECLALAQVAGVWGQPRPDGEMS
jgi:hypothetical protein